MAGDWLKCNFGLRNHRCVMYVASATGLDQDHVVGKLMRLWEWAQTQTETGKVRPCNIQMVDSIVGSEGFGKALAESEWIEVGDGWVRFTRWDEHNSKGAKERALDNARKRRNVSGNLPDDNRKVSGKVRYQSRAEQSGAREEANTSACQIHEGKESLRSALRGCGLTAEQVMSLVTHERASEEKLCHAAARYQEEVSRGKRIRHPVRWIERVAGIRESNAPEKLAARKVEAGRQLDAARRGATHGVRVGNIQDKGTGLDVVKSPESVQEVPKPVLAEAGLPGLPRQPSMEGETGVQTSRVSSMRAMLRSGDPGSPQDVRAGGVREAV